MSMNSKNDSKLHKAISSSFARLKPKTSQSNQEVEGSEVEDLAYAQLICNTAADIVIRLNGIPTSFKTPRNYIRDKASTRKELKNLQNLLDLFSFSLLQQIANLNADAISAIGGKDVLVHLSENVATIAGQIESIIDSSKPVNTPRKLRNGAPINLRATHVANAIATYYQRITGKHPTIIKDAYTDPPTISGNYYFLVQEIFDLLKIDANVEHFARKASKTLSSLTR